MDRCFSCDRESADLDYGKFSNGALMGFCPKCSKDLKDHYAQNHRQTHLANTIAKTWSDPPAVISFLKKCYHADLGTGRVR